MNEEIADRLVKINKTFYRDLARQFSSTRMRVQPGIKRIIAQIPENTIILDIGCGNGELFLELSRTGFQGIYTGIDFSPEMVTIAKDRSSRHFLKIMDNDGLKVNNPIFLERDVSDSNWSSGLPSKTYNYILAFSVLHHIPGLKMRINFLLEAHKLLHPDGFLYFSVWQFLNSPKLRKRIVPWNEVGLENNMVDPMDYLLDWKHQGYGYRYVHLFNRAELDSLAERTGFSIEKTFISDGDGGNLGMYQIWTKN